MGEDCDTNVTDNPTRIEDDAECFRCGYNLRTISAAASCPECGFPVKNSTGLGPTRCWPLTAENACGWMSIGLLTLWLCGAGLLLWTIGLALLTLRAPKIQGPLVVLVCICWATLVALIVSLVVLEFNLGRTTPVYVVTGLILVHYAAVMLVAIRLTHDANMAMARTAGYILIVMPFVLFPAMFFYPQISFYPGSLGGAISVGLWLLFTALFWMGLSSGLSGKRHTLLKAAGIDPYEHKSRRRDITV